MWSLQDAKNRFSAVVDAALAGEPQEVTRRGKPAVVVLSAVEYARILSDAKGSRGSFTEHLLSQPHGGVDDERVPVRPRDVVF
ncbi:MAG: type II toxin-antitoxin system Phd/YefM family antitoxin [Paracoccus denitrificans]|uniref:Antitoxin n=1 Tax=Paracoccus denitrificans TaxID=266 RepID=A0A533I4L7_PARDE|nr:MAG: type II toxin-antitoxin system Phd/YefM family antitoxin [Paracoccus denitrificans]